MSISLILMCSSIALLSGFYFGVVYTKQYSQLAKNDRRKEKIILRMISKLREHYTNEYIYWELIKNEYDKTITKTTNT